MTLEELLDFHGRGVIRSVQYRILSNKIIPPLGNTEINLINLNRFCLLPCLIYSILSTNDIKLWTRMLKINVDPPISKCKVTGLAKFTRASVLRYVMQQFWIDINGIVNICLHICQPWGCSDCSPTPRAISHWASRAVSRSLRIN